MKNAWRLFLLLAFTDTAPKLVLPRKNSNPMDEVTPKTCACCGETKHPNKYYTKRRPGTEILYKPNICKLCSNKKVTESKRRCKQLKD